MNTRKLLISLFGAQMDETDAAALKKSTGGDPLRGKTGRKDRKSTGFSEGQNSAYDRYMRSVRMHKRPGGVLTL